ncbi:MAG TPA: hypothetical protein VK085_01330, partial [Pseudogracilibacillus sp.]|nr:hypothetical protein [Pseudogracilibacillus sp.]
MKNFDYKKRMNRNRKRYAKRIAGLTVATTLVLSAPIAPNVMSTPALQDAIGPTVAHAAVDNLMNHERSRTNTVETINDYYEFNSYIIHVTPYTDTNLRDMESITFMVQLPNEFSYWLYDDLALDRLFDDFVMSSYVEFSDGEVGTINPGDLDYPAGNYVTVDNATNTVKFDITQFLNDNNLKFPAEGEPNNTVNVPFALDWGNLPANGTYELKTALVATDSASATMEEVSNPFIFDFVVENTDPEYERPEDPDDGDGDADADADA